MKIEPVILFFVDDLTSIINCKITLIKDVRFLSIYCEITYKDT